MTDKATSVSRRISWNPRISDDLHDVIPLDDMAYTLQALIAKNGVLGRTPIESGIVVPLEQGFEMLPFSRAFIEKHHILFLPLTDEGLEHLPENVKALCSKFSMSGHVAYVEAEFFGGDGAQGCAVFKSGEMALGPTVGDAAINEALAILGVNKKSSHDEFEALGLNKHRNTDAWLKKNEA